jgi:hypothetical protein
MPSNISRRTVAKGAAWTVPVVAVGAAAPAMAASGISCPTSARLVSATATGGGSNKTWTVVISFEGLVAGQEYSASITVTDSKGSGGSESVTFTPISSIHEQTFVARRHDNGSTTSIVSISYTIRTTPDGQVCTGSVNL